MNLDLFFDNLHFDVEKVRQVDIPVDWDEAPQPFKIYRNLPTLALPAQTTPASITIAASSGKPVHDIVSQPKLVQVIGDILRLTYGLSRVGQLSSSWVDASAYGDDSANGDDNNDFGKDAANGYVNGDAANSSANDDAVNGNANADSFSPYFTQILRRFVPSGGALYPNEVYLYLREQGPQDEGAQYGTQGGGHRTQSLQQEGLREGVYHYDVSHHCLELIREGNFDDYLCRTLGDERVSSYWGMIFVSTLFWKNYFKYHDFSYRLQALDAGVVLGQLLEVTSRYEASTPGIAAHVRYHFLDEALNHLLGLSAEVESVYAVLLLGDDRAPADVLPSVHRLTHGCQVTLEPIAHEYTLNSRFGSYPVIVQATKASMLHSLTELRKNRVAERDRISELYATTAWKPQDRTATGASSDASSQGSSSYINEVVVTTDGIASTGEGVKLPDVPALEFDFEQACRKRYSPGMDFVFKPVTSLQLATLLKAALPHRDGTHPAREQMSSEQMSSEQMSSEQMSLSANLGIAVCLHGIKTIPDGAYFYDERQHMLRPLREGDHRLTLQTGMSMQNVTLWQVPLCFHLIGERSHLKPSFGYRGYRIQQMQVGIVLQRLLLTGSALGLGGHPLLDFDESLCDEIYRLNETPRTCFIQVPMGHFRQQYRFELSL